MRLYGCTDIFCIAEYRGTQDMYSTVTCIFLICIYMHMDAPFCDVVLVVRTWMRFMICDMFVLHVDANSLGCWAGGFPLCVLCDVT